MPERSKRIRIFIFMVLITALSYFLLDFPVHKSGAYDFPDGIGIKNFLPYTLGLFFGPAGALGCVLGAFLSNFALGLSMKIIAAEVICAFVVSIGTWMIWFAFNRDGNVRLESNKNYVLYLLIVVGMSLTTGGINALILGKSAFGPIMVGYFMAGLLVSSLVIILLGGIFCVDPIRPIWCSFERDVKISLPASAAATDEINDMIEDVCRSKKIPIKRAFEIESSLEELYLRIRKAGVTEEVTGSIDFGVTISLRLEYEGKKYDPLTLDVGEDEMDIVSLKLIRHRALRASYSNHHGKNHVHIVV